MRDRTGSETAGQRQRDRDRETEPDCSGCELQTERNLKLEVTQLLGPLQSRAAGEMQKQSKDNSFL